MELVPISRTASFGMGLVRSLEGHGRRDVADILSFYHIHHEFGNIRRVISDAFQRFGDEGESDGARNGFGIFQHEGEEFPEELLVQVIHEIVVTAHLARETRIGIHERIETFLDHAHRPMWPCGGYQCTVSTAARR